MSQPKEIGTLVVVVLKAQHLHQPSFYKQNPFAQVSLSGLKKRTKVDTKGGQHPVWDDEFRFPVLADAGKDKTNRILEVSCYKDEQRGDDVLLGKGTVDIDETLKTGEFDDWVALETSAGIRGQVYLELTFYANSPPPLTRRPSKLSPSDRLARPAAYVTQGRQSNPTSTSSSPQRGHSPVAGERKLPPTQIPSSLIPAHGPQSQTPRQTPSHAVATSAIVAKHKDSLPPLPADNDPPDVDSGKTPGLPAALHAGGRSGPRSIPPQIQNRETTMGRPPPETLPDQFHKRTPSDTPELVPPLPLSQLQVCSTGLTSTTGERVGSIPSIVLAEHVEDHSLLAFRTQFASPPVPTQEHEPRGVYAAGNDPLAYGPPGPYMQPGSQGYIPVPAQAYPPTFSPSQHRMPLQALHIPSQSQHLYDAPPSVIMSPPFHQQYTQYSGGSLTPQPPTLPQTYFQLRGSPQPQQQQAPSPPQHSPLHQQPYFPQQYLPPPPPPQQQQYLQYPPYSRTPHPDVPQPQHTIVQQPYSQVPQQPQQSYFAVPPPPVQSQTPQPCVPQRTHQPQPYFSPPPPPPPPLSYNQAGSGPSPVSIAQSSQVVPPSQLSQGQASPPMQSVTPATPLLQPLTTTTLLSRVVSNSAPPSSTEDVVQQSQVEERKNDVELVTIAEMGTMLQEEVRETLLDAARDPKKEENIRGEQGQPMHLNDIKEQEMCKVKENQQQAMEEVRQQSKDLRKQEVLKRQEEEQRQEAERRMREDECRRRELEELERREEHRKMEEEHRRQEVEEGKIREEECRKREEEHKKQEEEEEHRRREEEHRRQEQLQREEHHRRAEEEARRRRTEEAKAERRWQEELARIRTRAEQEAADAAFARAQMEAEEAERREQEEADLALVRRAQEEAERAENLAQERRLQEEADMEVAKREQAHEEGLERRRQEERRRRMEEADRALARKLDMELNMEYGTDR